MSLDVIDAIESRRSIRTYERQAIPADVMAQILDAARLSPSANNRQGWNIVVVTDNGTLERLVPVSGGQRFVGECSAYLVGVAESGGTMSTVDISIALDHVSLRAVELGLGTCWIGDFDAKGTARVLGIPDSHEIPICMTLGYPKSSPAPRKRKPLGELFMSDGWGKPWF
jgi:nitroreductase